MCVCVAGAITVVRVCNTRRTRTRRHSGVAPRVGLFTRYCFTLRLYCTIIFFANTPFIVQYVVQYYQLLQPPAQFSGVLEVFGGVFWFLRVGFWMGRRGVRKKKSFSTRKRGHYCAISPSQTPLLPTILRNIFSPRPPLSLLLLQ